MSLHLLLPPKESFTPDNAGAIARVAADSLRHSRFRGGATVFGQPLDAPPLGGIAYQGLRSWHRFLHGRNIGFGKAYISWLRRQDESAWPDLIEVHGRCRLAGMVARAVPERPVVLFQHNDPRDMTGGRTVLERRGLANALAGVFSNSAYIEECFLDGLGTKGAGACRFATVRLGADRPKRRPRRQSRAASGTILFVGRMVPEKGALEAAEAMAAVLPDHPGWKLVMVGARRFEDAPENDYAKSVREALRPLGDQVRVEGYLPMDEVRARQAEAAVILAPSQWHEPAGLVVLEALAQGAALVTSRRGGIPEYAEGRAVLLDRPDAASIADATRGLLENPARMNALRDKAWKDYPFTIEAMNREFDRQRAAVISSRP